MTLEPALAHALAVWRTELGHAAVAAETESQGAGLEGRRVVVHVSYTGDVVEALREAGMETGFDSGGEISGNIALADVERLAEVPGVDAVRVQPRMLTDLNNTVVEMRVPWKVPPPPPSPWDGKGDGVIVAIIDTGIDIFHESFRKSDDEKRTRILELWDHDATAGGNPPPAGFTQSLGQVYNSGHINAALRAGGTFASLDKDGHGTHVAGIAAGDGSQDDRCHGPGHYVGVAPEADLVVARVIGTDKGNVEEALNWCAQAGARHFNKPVVINCSFGSYTGPHDGTGYLDGVVDRILRPASGPPPGLAVVKSAGNGGEGTLHEIGTVPPNMQVTVPFDIPEGSQKVDVLDIWYTGTASLNIDIVAPPNNAVSGPGSTGPIAPSAPLVTVNRTIGQQITVTVTSAGVPSVNTKKQIQVTISTPTTPPTQIRPGRWELKLTNTTSVAADWDAWIELEHGDSNPKFPGEPGPRRRENTLSGFGNSPNVITVANYDGDELYKSSSRGPANQTAPVGVRRPTLAAPGVAVWAPRSRDGKATRSSCCVDGQVVDKLGTSMAAPHVAGLVALMFQKNSTLTFEQVREHLQQSARIDGIPAAETPQEVSGTGSIRHSHLWGSGKVDAREALRLTPALHVVAAAAGGGAGSPLMFAPDQIGLTPHTLVSRLTDWQRRFGARPGVNLFAALISEHVDEVLRLVNGNRRVTIAWRRLGGPTLVRWMLHGPPPGDPLIPRRIDGCDVAELLTGFVAVLDRFAGPRLKADIARYADFVQVWPGGSHARLDEIALALGKG